MDRFLRITIFTAIFFALSGISAFAKPDLAFAQTPRCEPIYGGGQICPLPANIVINKTVFDPVMDEFVDNLGIDDTKFVPEQIVQFQVTITNTSQRAVENIKISDIFPQFVKFISGPGGFDESKNTLTLPFQRLDINESMTFDIAGQVFSQDRLPQDRNIICVVNQAVAEFEDKRLADNAQFCIQKLVVEITPTPAIPIVSPTPIPRVTPPVTIPAPRVTPIITPGIPPRVTIVPTPIRRIVPPVRPTVPPVRVPIVRPPRRVVTPPVRRVIVPPIAITPPVRAVPPVEEIPAVSKGGKPVFPPSQPEITPVTGPEMIPLMALLPSGALGWFLRKKSGKK